MHHARPDNKRSPQVGQVESEMQRQCLAAIKLCRSVPQKQTNSIDVMNPESAQIATETINIHIMAGGAFNGKGRADRSEQRDSRVPTDLSCAGYLRIHEISCISIHSPGFS
jgi:hypothetical protein